MERFSIFCRSLQMKDKYRIYDDEDENDNDDDDEDDNDDDDGLNRLLLGDSNRRSLRVSTFHISLVSLTYHNLPCLSRNHLIGFLTLP